jgi:hypothetical protein
MPMRSIAPLRNGVNRQDAGGRCGVNSAKFEKSMDDLLWRRTKVHFGVIVACTFYLLAVLAQTVRFHELNNEMLATDAEYVAAAEDGARLALEYERIRNPARIRALAATTLGLITPDASRIRSIASPEPPAVEEE